MPDLIAIIEGLWAQTGPSLLYLYKPPFYTSPDEHPHIAVINALRERRANDAVAAIVQDVSDYGAALMARLPAEMI